MVEAQDDPEAHAQLEAWRNKRQERNRRRANEEAQDEFNPGLTEDDTAQLNQEDSVEFVPFAKRRKQEQLALLEQDRYAHRRRVLQNEAPDEEVGMPTTKTIEGGNGENDEGGTEQQVESLLESAAALQQSLTEEERASKQRKEEETRILKEANKVQANALQAASEVAKGVAYTDPLPSTWTCPRYILDQGPDVWNKIRKEWHMDVEGMNIPPPCKRFQDLKFPKPILDLLVKKGIKRPTPIQMQGLTVALASRDMIGIAFTGSGKTLTFSLPMVMAALEEEMRLPLVAGEGPIGIILAPSRELARQTFDQVKEFCQVISDTPGYPELRAQLLIGGEPVRQTESLLTLGSHCVVATPGRLRDILKRKTMKLDNC
jgi:ATP-dependent RNA helicase DDX41